MVKLFNIFRSGDVIQCDYAPEDCDKSGHISVNIHSEEIEEISYSEYKYGKNMYAAHVRSKLIELWKSNKPIPKEAFAIWF